jgi:hypothetical protein
VAGGVALLEAVQTLILWLVFGDPLYRLHAVSSGHLPQMEMYAHTPGYMPAHIDWSHLTTRFLDQTNSEPAYGAGPFIGYWHLLVGSFVVALGVAIWKRDRLLLGFAAFVLVAYATLTFTIVSLDPLIPVVRTIGRYFLVVLTLLPSFIVAGLSLLLRDLSERLNTKRGLTLCTGLLMVACLAYTSTAYASAAYHLAHNKRLIANGGTRVARTGKGVRRYVLAHPEVRRVVGPKLIRGGGFSWGLDVEMRGMPRSKLSGFKKRNHDLLLDEEPALVTQSAKLVWRQVGKAGSYKLAHIGEFGGPHTAGEWEIPALSEKQLGLTSRTSLAIRLEVRTKNVRLEPLELVAYGNRARTLERIAWTAQADTYTIDLESKPFRTKQLKACTLRLTAKGRGSFEIVEHEVSATRSASAAQRRSSGLRAP